LIKIDLAAPFERAARVPALRFVALLDGRSAILSLRSGTRPRMFTVTTGYCVVDEVVAAFAHHPRR
jgi:hypothetical protein